jgi:hypothetical protein
LKLKKSDLQKISDLEVAYYRVQKIRKELDTLADFIVAALHKKPQSKTDAALMDPRTGKPFNRKGSSDQQ